MIQVLTAMLLFTLVIIAIAVKCPELFKKLDDSQF